MKFNKVLFFIIFLGILIELNAQKTQQQVITIEYAGTNYSDPELEEGADVFLRDNRQQVHFIHSGVNMWCDKAIYYQDQEFIEAFGNVKMIQGDTINMTSKYVEYSGITQLAFASGDVVLTDPKSTLTTDTLYFDRAKQQAFYKTKGKVVRDTTATITSQIGRYYMSSKKYQFVQDVVLVNPEYQLDTERLDFFTETGYAYSFGPTTITGEDSKSYGERGFYDTERKVGYFLRNAKIDYDNRNVIGDSLYFDQNRNFASANNNIVITDTINNAIAKGHYAEVWKDKDSVFITKRALAISVEEQDSIYMHADTLMITGKPEHRITRAFYDVRIYKSDLAGKSDSIHVNHKTGLTEMINLDRFSSSDVFATARKPILWNLRNQMTGDTIHLISNVETEKLDTLKVFNNAFLTSRDTLSEDGYNQTKGQKLIALFNDANEIYQVDIIKNAEVIYYSRNDDGELVGIDKSKSGKIVIKLSNNEVDELIRYNQIDGQTFPESKYPKGAKRLRGFDWRGNERPLSVEDLFKDDPPLNLPKIKGLDDYVPPEEFVDDDLLKRVEAAEKLTPNKPNKAARNLPLNSTKQNTVKKPKPILQKKDN